MGILIMDAKHNRWYDKQPMVKQSVELLAAFPDEVLTIMAEGINSVIEREYRVQELLRSFKSLGQEKILALYKSKQKLRKLDQNPMMHKTVNYLFVVAEENKQQIARHVLELISTVHSYLLLMREAKQSPTLQHILEIRNTYVSHGIEAAKQQVKAIELEISQSLLLGRVSAAPALTPPPGPKREIEIKEDDSGGMKINFNQF